MISYSYSYSDSLYEKADRYVEYRLLLDRYPGSYEALDKFRLSYFDARQFSLDELIIEIYLDENIEDPNNKFLYFEIGLSNKYRWAPEDNLWKKCD